METNSYDCGNSFIDGKPMYWDKNDDGTTNIFPGGLPGAQSHDHIVVNEDGGVEYMRIGGVSLQNIRQHIRPNEPA